MGVCGKRAVRLRGGHHGGLDPPPRVLHVPPTASDPRVGAGVGPGAQVGFMRRRCGVWSP
jgi:hypothetical protein